MSTNDSTPDPTAGERDAATLRTVAAELVRRDLTIMAGMLERVAARLLPATPNADDRLITCPECRSTFEAEDGSLVATMAAANASTPDPTAGEHQRAAIAARARGDYEAERRALDALALIERATPPDTASTPASEGLTEAEREALGDWWESDWPDTKEGAIGSLYAVVAQIKADAETKARADERERIARAIEGLPEYDGAGWPNHAHEIKEDAARIARGDA